MSSLLKRGLFPKGLIRAAKSCRFVVLPCVLIGAISTTPSHAQGLHGYKLVEQFELPAGAGPLGSLSDGRLVTVIGSDLYVETAAGSRSFAVHGALPSADLSAFGAAFVRVSPDGSRLAIGNNGGASFTNYQVGVFDFPSLTGTWFDVPHLDAAWADADHLALTAGDFGFPSRVTLLDTNSVDPGDPDNPTILDNIGGASGGVAFDEQGNLYTGNGFSIAGPSGTGLIKVFTFASWMAAAGGTPIDFENEGVVVAELLSASPLGFDGSGHLTVGGGDFSEIGQSDYVALVNASAIADVLAGGGPINVGDSHLVRRLDPDSTNDGNFYTFAFNPQRGELYVNDFGQSRMYVYRDLMGVPAVSTWGMLVLGLLLAAAATLTMRGTLYGARHCGNSSMTTSARHMALAIVPLMLLANGTAAGSPFASRVIEYHPAPGQFVNHPAFNDPTRALGPPTGGGTLAPNNESLVSLGGFGGSITLGFDRRVEDHLLNPLGLDAIVFGNAVWIGGDAQTRLAECGIIEISLDANGNGLADDPWYLIPGSHLGPAAFPRHVQTWDDQIADATHPPAFVHWIPPGASGTWITESFLLPAKLLGRFSVRNPFYPLEGEGVYGYADCSPTLTLGDLDGDGVVDDATLRPEQFYTVPDDPFTVGIDFGSGGGDAFDIAWAVDPTTGLPAHLPGFDFIRITSAIHSVFPPLGEVSTEIDAVAAVALNPTGDVDRDGDLDLRDAAVLQACMGVVVAETELCALLARQGGSRIGLNEAAWLIERMTGPRSP